MRVLDSCHITAAKHHLVFRERAGFIRENVLHLAKVFCDVQSPALEVRVCFLIVQLHVLMDKVHLAYLHYFNGNKERDWDQHLHQRKREVERFVVGSCRVIISTTAEPKTRWQLKETFIQNLKRVII